jgi:hypothetical protein
LLTGYSNPKERHVVELRKEGMTYQQIAKEARISVRDIKPILDKYRVDDLSGYSGNDSEGSDSLMSISSRAYKLFHEEIMLPLEVAIALNIEAQDAIRYYNEFLEMNNRGTLAKLFNEIGNEGISWLLQLCAVARSKKMSISQVIECVSIYGKDLPMIKQMCEDANSRLGALQKQEYQCENRVEYLNHQTEKLGDEVKSKQVECKKLDKIRMAIIGQTLRLRHFVSEFKDNNAAYIKIERFVEDTIDRILREGDNMKLLEFALISVLKLLPGSDQYKYRYLLHKLDLVEVSGSFDTPITSTTNTIPRIESNTLVVRNNNSISYSNKAPNQYHHSYLSSKSDHCPACFEREILTMSKMYFEMLRKQITDEIMTTILKENLSGSKIET